MLTSNWEFSTSSLRYTVVNFTQITHFLIISLYIEDIETSLSIGKHTLRAFTWNFEEIVVNGLLRCFIYVFVSIYSFYSHFHDLCCWTQRCGLLSRIHFRVTDQTWQTGPKESVLHFEVAFVVCWHQFVQVVYYTVELILLKLHQFWS